MSKISIPKSNMILFWTDVFTMIDVYKRDCYQQILLFIKGKILDGVDITLAMNEILCIIYTTELYMRSQLNSWRYDS